MANPMTTRPKIVKASPKPDFIRPEEYLRCLDPVVAQPDLKRKISSAFSQYSGYRINPIVGRPLVLIAGPSGTGKTFAAELLGKASNLPFTAVAAASMALTAHKGLTFRDLLVQHITEFKTDEGIIFVDEIDKWCRGAIGNDAETVGLGNRMQAEALRMVKDEKAVLGDEMEMEDDDTEEDITFNTSKTMWVLAGAFTGIDKLIRARLHGHSNTPEDELWKQLVPQDFIRYGMLIELIGRVNTIAWTVPLTIQEMVQILEEQEIPRWTAMFEMVGCDLTIATGALSSCADRAHKEKTGARGAVSFLQRGMEDIYTHVSENHVKKLTVTSVSIETGRIDIEIGSEAIS